MNKQKIYNELDNIWYHYKPHILAGVFIAAIVIYFVISTVHHQAKESALNVILIGNQISVEQQKRFQQTAREKINSNSVIQTDFLVG